MEQPLIKSTPTEDIFLVWEKEGVTVLLHCDDPKKLKPWAALLASTPDIMKTCLSVLENSVGLEDKTQEILDFQNMLRELKEELDNG